MLHSRRRSGRFDSGGRFGESGSGGNGEKFVLFEGDSFTANDIYPSDAIGQLSGFTYVNIATAGASMTTFESRAATADSYYDGARSENILFILSGTNDESTPADTAAASYLAALKSYCLDRRAAGWKVIICTMLPAADPDRLAFRNAANARIPLDTSYFDAICPFASDPTIGVDAAASDTTYFLDGLHPTEASDAIMADIAAATINDADLLSAAVSVVVTPDEVSVNEGAGQQFYAYGLDSGGRRVYNPVPTWATTNGTITSGGLLTAGAAATGQMVTATVGAVSGTAALTVTASSLLTGLVSYWKLDGNSTDAAGSNNGTDTDVTYSAGNGKINSGAGFNGSTSVINIANGADLKFSTAFTVAYWFKRVSGRKIVAGKYKGGGLKAYILSIYLDDVPRVVVSSDGSSDTAVFASNTTTTDTGWNHLVGTYDSASLTLRLYLNGSLLAGTLTGVVPASIFSANTGAQIGTYIGGVAEGAMDEVAMWSRALSLSEVQALYNSGAGLQYPF